MTGASTPADRTGAPAVGGGVTGSASVSGAVGSAVGGGVAGPDSGGGIARFASGGPWEQRYGYSRVVRAGDLVVTAGCTATVDGVVVGVGDPAAQARTAFRIGLDALAAAGAGPADVIRTRMYVTDRAYAEAVTGVHGEMFGDVRPVTALIVVAGLLHEDHLVEVELDAYAGGKVTS